MISFLVTPRVSALTGCDRLVSEPLVIENYVFPSPVRSLVGEPFSQLDLSVIRSLFGTEGDRIVDHLSDACNRAGPAESGDSCGVELYRYSLIPLSRGSFDVIVGMDMLSKRKFVIVCHEKVVRIPLEGDEILRVHGERTQGVVKTLMNKSECSGEALLERRIKTSKRNDTAPKVRRFKKENVLVDRLRGLDQQWERKRRREFVLYGSNLGSIGRKCNGCSPCIKILEVKAQCPNTFRQLCCKQPEYLSENEIESPWISSQNSQGQSSEYECALGNGR
ncbi:hypothetical protein Tco_0708451 [Tanacetum coccineum]